jgi:myosin-18
MRTIEQQLEDEQNEKSTLQRQKREIEIHLQEAYARQTQRTGDDGTEAQLRRDLRKTKALLKDAQAVLQHQRDNAPTRGLLKQLRNQVKYFML